MRTEPRDLAWLTDGTDQEGIVELALSASSMVMWRFGLFDESLTWMTGLDEVLGMPGAAEATIRDRLYDLLSPMITAARTAAVWQDFELEQPSGAPDGGTRWIQLRARVLGSERQRALVGIATDVTERHDSRQALTDLADRYRLLVDLSPDAIGVHQNGVVVYANPATVQILGARSTGDIVGRPITAFVHPDSVPDMQRRLATLAPGAASDPAEATMVRFDGTTLPVESVSVSTTWEGRPAFQVILRDITAQKAAEAALRYQAALASHVSDAIIAVHSDGTVASWNPAAELVYACPAETAIGRPVSELVGAPLDPETIIQAGGVILATHIRSDGSTLYVRVSAAEMATGYVLVCADETARRRAEQHYTTVVASLEEGVVVVGPEGLIESVNPAAQRLLGGSEADLVGSDGTIFDLYDDAGELISLGDRPIARTRRTGHPQQGQVVCVRRPDGERAWLSLSCQPLYPEDGPPYAVVGSFTDITERRAIGERLAYEATHDQLTGLANRALVIQRLTVRPSRGRHRGPVRGPRQVQGHQRLARSRRRRPGAVDRRRAAASHRPRHRPRRPVGRRRVRRHRHRAGRGERGRGDRRPPPRRTAGSGRRRRPAAARRARASASSWPSPTTTGRPRNCYGTRTWRCTRRRRRTGGSYAIFGVELRERVQRRLQLEEDLRAAVATDELWIAYQPVVELPTGRMIGVEALLRWNHPQHGAISPVEFIPVAEESGSINEIGAHTLGESCRTLVQQRALHHPDVHLAVNLSAVQLDDPQLTSMVHQILAASGLPPSALCLEITESMLMRDQAAATRRLHALRDLGVRLAIDDFGTGYSSLAQLQRLPLDALKIDRSFVSGLGESKDAEAIVKSIIAMAHAVDLTVVAEGVETEQQLDVLQRLNCDEAQGFYFGRPTPAPVLFQ